MIYFFINIISYLIVILLLVRYYYDKMNSINFIIILFNMNVFFFFIYQNINFIYGVLVLIITLILKYFINLFTSDNKEIILIKDGNINFHELINHYSYYKLVNYLKRHHINLSEVNYCIKYGNKLTIIKNKNIGFPISIIVDGKLINNNLKLIKKEENWLKEELKKRNLSLSNIDFAYYKNNNIYFINNS